MARENMLRGAIAQGKEALLSTSAELANVRDMASDRGPAALSLRARIASRQRTWLAAALIVILCTLVVPPFIFLLQGSFTVAGPTYDTARWGLDNFDAVLRARN